MCWSLFSVFFGCLLFRFLKRPSVLYRTSPRLKASRAYHGAAKQAKIDGLSAEQVKHAARQAHRDCMACLRVEHAAAAEQAATLPAADLD